MNKMADWCIPKNSRVTVSMSYQTSRVSRCYVSEYRFFPPIWVIIHWTKYIDFKKITCMFRGMKGLYSLYSKPTLGRTDCHILLLPSVHLMCSSLQPSLMLTTFDSNWKQLLSLQPCTSHLLLSHKTMFCFPNSAQIGCWFCKQHFLGTFANCLLSVFGLWKVLERD